MLANLFCKSPRVVMPALLLVMAIAPAARGERLPIKTYTTADGLADNLTLQLTLLAASVVLVLFLAAHSLW